MQHWIWVSNQHFYRVEKNHGKLLQGCPVADHAGYEYMLTAAYVQINICFALSSKDPEFRQPEFNILEMLHVVSC
jgi:hypothetical protein